MPYRRKNTGRSIRWKWGFRLTAALFLIYLFGSGILLNEIHDYHYKEEKQDAQALITAFSQSLGQYDTQLTEANVASFFNKISVATTTRGVLKVDNLPYLEVMEDEGITVRVFNDGGRMLYESQKNYSGFTRRSGTYLDEVTLSNRSAFLGGSTIVSEEDSILLGYVQVIFRLNNYHDMVTHNNRYVFVLSLIALVISILLGYGLAQLFSRPIQQMADTMKEVTEDTLSRTRVSIKNPSGEDEITELSTNINSLLDKMARYVTQQKQFVEDVSHELRTPTAIVEGHLKLLNRWGKDDPQVLEESLAASLNEIQRMKTLVQEMLDLSRAEQVQINYQNEVTPVGQVITQVYHNFQVLYPEFVFYLDDDLPEERYLNIYRNHLEQILVILIDNAVKYSTDRKEIHIALSEMLNHVQIAIQDFGEGISQEDQQQIFNRFYRVDKARSREKGGHGLGLSIAQQLIEGYKGNITVESVLGYGTVFRIEFPYLPDYDPTEKHSEPTKKTLSD